MAEDKYIALNYGEAIFNSFSSRREHKEILLFLEEINQLLCENNYLLQNFFSNPVVNLQKKQQMIELISKQTNIPKKLHHALILIVQNERIGIFVDIYSKYKKILHDTYNEKKVFVTSSQKLTKEDIVELKKYLTKLTRKEVELATSIDPKLIRGIEIRYDNVIIDYSLRSVLDNFTLPQSF